MKNDAGLKSFVSRCCALLHLRRLVLLPHANAGIRRVLFEFPVLSLVPCFPSSFTESRPGTSFSLFQCFYIISLCRGMLASFFFAQQNEFSSFTLFNFRVWVGRPMACAFNILVLYSFNTRGIVVSCHLLPIFHCIRPLNNIHTQTFATHSRIFSPRYGCENMFDYYILLIEVKDTVFSSFLAQCSIIFRKTKFPSSNIRWEGGEWLTWRDYRMKNTREGSASCHLDGNVNEQSWEIWKL